MASIQKRTDGQWRARYRDHSGKEHARHFSRKVDAQSWLDEVTASVVTGAYIDPKAAKTTLGEYAARWEAAQIGRPGTARIVDNALRLHILPRFGDRPMQSILRSDVQAMVKALSETLAPGTVRNVYDTLAKVLGAAVDDRKLAVSPCRKIGLPTDGRGEVQPPTADDVAALVNAVPDRYRALVVLLAGSGMRIGEALGLQVSDVKFLERTVRVERQRLQSGQMGPTKTDESVRTIPLGQIVTATLAGHLAAYPTDADLFLATHGQPLRYGAWKDIWTRANSETGLAISTHGLRHFFASGLIAGGASVKQVQEVLGHASPVITLKVYSHLWPGDDERIRTISDSTLDGLRTSCGLEAV